uniref:Uncharacterized protein n=1 Tax=Heterosigma akashiwo TaxID=2829 RepID=A0A6V1SVF3_HETAK|mmetsp:Transcript_28135/g.43919  ORF Transcript_28135/g.43919 Transcript_28135/m.43919 type:complete len:102 (+) Transcript_28135:58-363(+)
MVETGPLHTLSEYALGLHNIEHAFKFVLRTEFWLSFSNHVEGRLFGAFSLMTRRFVNIDHSWMFVLRAKGPALALKAERCGFEAVLMYAVVETFLVPTFLA